MKYSYSISFLMIASIISSTKANLRVKRILGGKDATAGQIPYQVSLQQYGSHICGGGILNNLFILTAAHCIVDGKGAFLEAPLTVVMGTVDLKNPDQHTIKIKALKYFIPSEYNPNDRPPIADIALIKLERPIEMEKDDKFITNLVLPKEPYSLYSGLPTIISGFGLNKIQVHTNPKTNKSFEMGESFGKMRYLAEKVMDNEDCDKVLTLAVHPQHLCAKAIRKNFNPEGVCAGDSGGPLVINGKEVIGVLSQGPIGCKEIRGAGRYTRVTSYIEFIKNSLKEIHNKNIREAEWITPNITGRLILLEKRLVNCRRSV